MKHIILAWRIPGMGEPGGLLSMGLHRVRHDSSDLAAAAAAAGFPGGSNGNVSACNARDLGSTWVRSLVGKIPWRRKWQPTPAFLPGKSHGWRTLVGYSPWGCKEMDTTE